MGYGLRKKNQGYNCVLSHKLVGGAALFKMGPRSMMVCYFVRKSKLYLAAVMVILY